MLALSIFKRYDSLVLQATALKIWALGKCFFKVVLLIAKIEKLGPSFKSYCTPISKFLYCSHMQALDTTANNKEQIYH